MAHWLTVAAFIALGVIAIGVFVLLPRWVPEPGTATQSEATAELADTQPQASPSPPTADDGLELEWVEEPVGESLAPSGAATSTAPAPADDGPSPERGEEHAQESLVPSREPSPAPAPAEAQAEREPSRTQADKEFARAMAEGFAHLDQGELTQARAAFERAGVASPGAPEASAGLARVAAAQQLIDIGAQRDRALAAEEKEEWAEAAAAYAAVLKLDPTIQFAQTGQARAAARHALQQRLEGHLQRPDRLASDEVLDDARKTLADAEQVSSPEPGLENRITRLRGLIEVAATPIQVVLLSDNRTEVLVYRVGRLGAFERRELELRPGSYTVVGSREGFRDVRHQLEVAPGSAPTMTVRCEEEI